MDDISSQYLNVLGFEYWIQYQNTVKGFGYSNIRILLLRILYSDGSNKARMCALAA